VKIKKAFETPEGTVQFECEFGPEETQFMVEWFLNTMFQKGALPFMMKKDEHSFLKSEEGKLN